MKPGGTEGGSAKWVVGAILAGVGLYLLFDSVRVSSGGAGLLSGMVGGRRGGGWWDTTSMGIIFVPFLISMIALFVNAKWRLAWWGLWLSLAIIVVEMFSRVKFLMDIKTTHLLMMLVLFCAGVGLMIRAYLEGKGRMESAGGAKSRDTAS